MNYGQAKCVECHISLIFVDPEGKDTETIGGYAIEYLECPKCKQLYSHIYGDSPNDLCME
jgi:uncharacterized protein with PIN domain